MISSLTHPSEPNAQVEVPGLLTKILVALKTFGITLLMFAWSTCSLRFYEFRRKEGLYSNFKVNMRY
jgi:hypothetical protein